MSAPPASAQPVAPDSVHVWRGFRASGKSYQEFVEFLGGVFVPACVLLQPNAGLRAYIPSMPGPKDKPVLVPDQTALMFWATQQAYGDAFKTPAVRAYTNLHGGGYGPGSSAQFPIALADRVAAEQPYYLVDVPADWMLGGVRHLVGARRGTQTSVDFLAAVYAWAAAYRRDRPPAVDGALLCAGESYVLLWEHWPAAVADSPFSRLLELVTPYPCKEAERVAPGGGLWDPWPGFDLTRQDCINIQLDRPAESRAERTT
jgi:hypothetical protein